MDDDYFTCKSKHSLTALWLLGDTLVDIPKQNNGAYVLASLAGLTAVYTLLTLVLVTEQITLSLRSPRTI